MTNPATHTRQYGALDFQSIIDGEMHDIFDAGYIYDPNAKIVSQKRPDLMLPAGTKMNCEGAALLLINLAKSKGVTCTLVRASPKCGNDYGFILLADPSSKALNSTRPPISCKYFCGWEFDQHFRVRDQAGRTFDPTFATSFTQNFSGIALSKVGIYDAPTHSIISEYGEKYRVTRSLSTNEYDCELMTKAAVSKTYLIDDQSYLRV